MTRLLNRCIGMLLMLSPPVWAQSLDSEYRDWVSRFQADMALAETAPAGTNALFDRSQWAHGSSIRFLQEMLVAGQLFGKTGNRRVWSTGTALRYLVEESTVRGSGGTAIGRHLNGNLPDEVLEVVYLLLPAEQGSRIERLLRRQWGVDELKLPPTGELRRNAYPFLLFRRIDGKLYLAAFSREFMTMVEAIFSIQIAAVERPLSPRTPSPLVPNTSSGPEELATIGSSIAA